jgi:hypothetical protein
MVSAMLPTATPVRGKERPRIALAPADEAILRALLRYHYLTSAQVCRLLYSPKSLTHVRERLRRLAQATIIQKTFIPTITGQPPALFSLATRGMNYLAAQGFPVPTRFRPSESQRSDLHARHTQAVNDFLISLELFLGSWPEVSSWEIVHEREVKRQPIQVAIAWGRKGEPQQERVPLLPDAWITLTYRSGKQRRVALELDRGTEEQQKWRRKVRAYLAYSETLYPAHHAPVPLTIAVVATPSHKRREVLVRWTQAELEVTGLRKRAFLFRLAHLSGSEPARTVFLAPRWYRPFDAKQLTLIPLRRQPVAGKRG